MIAIESVLNGFFFASGSDLGLIGGIGTAVGISVTNVVLAFFAGLLPFRWINHRALLVKSLGVLISFAAVASLVGLHAVAAHLREAALAGISESQQLIHAIQQLLSSPLTLKDINSFYLFGFGAILALVAAWKGAAFDDPYPGYGSAARRADKARILYSEEHHDIFDHLDEIKDTILQQIVTGIG